MKAVSEAPDFKDVETFDIRHKSSIEYVKELKKICITMLGIPESTIETTPRSVELDASESFYKDSLSHRRGDALLGFVPISFWKLQKARLNFPQQILCCLITLRTGGTRLRPALNSSDAQCHLVILEDRGTSDG